METTANPSEQLINEYQLAQLVGLSVASIRRWRSRRTGPKYFKIGSAVRYDPSEIQKWIKSLPTGGGGKPLDA